MSSPTRIVPCLMGSSVLLLSRAGNIEGMVTSLPVKDEMVANGSRVNNIIEWNIIPWIIEDGKPLDELVGGGYFGIPLIPQFGNSYIYATQLLKGIMIHIIQFYHTVGICITLVH